MKLPTLKSFSKNSNRVGLFNGIGENKLFDAVNLVCTERCNTRSPRKAIMLNQMPPDQIIPCDNRLFFRFGNALKEITQNQDGSLSETENRYILKDINPSPDRKLIFWEDDLYVLPDNIRVGVDTWMPFASGYEPSVAFPFINPRTLYYPSGFSGGNYCEDADFLEIGVKLRFSWAPSKTFTIKTIENDLNNYDGSDILDGVRITLDEDVPKYNSLPANAKAEYTFPKNRPILNDLMIGYNHRIVFSERSISFYNISGNYSFSLNEYFRIGQTVKISGCSEAKNNVYAKISNISSSSLHFDKEFVTVREAEKRIITLTPLIPDFSHILLTENRLFGVDNSRGKFYISALNNPFLFFDSPTLPEDPWSVKINGTASGITLWKDNIICFTEDGGFRILGYHALNFGVRQLSLNGIKKGAEKSLVRVGDTLYYFSGKGIMKYSGGSDKKISGEIPKKINVKTAISDDAFIYMLSNDRIWVYDTEIEQWWSENAEDILDLFKFNEYRYLVSNRTIYLAESDLDIDVNWSFELPTITNAYKKIQPLYMVINCLDNTNCTFSLYFKKHGDSNWESLGVFIAENEGDIKIPLPKNYCSGFKIKIIGKGEFYPDFWSVSYKNL